MAQDLSLTQKLLDELVKNGFENIHINHDSDKIIIAYENRVYRFDVDAIKEVFKIVTPIIIEQKKIILIPENRKIPLVVIEVGVKDCKDYLFSKISMVEFAERLKIIFDTDSVWQELKNGTEFNSSNFRFDVTVKPTIAAQFGIYTDPVLWQLNFVSGIKSSFWKGMLFNYELIIPIHNDLLPMEDSVRTGLVVMNQTFRLPNSFFVSTSAGYFSNNRYGLDFEAKKYFSNGDINVGINFGITSFAYFVGKRFNYSDQFIWTGNINLDIRIPEYDLTLGISAGKFLMGDNSVRFDVSREFREIEIGFFAIRSSNGISNGGINISIPIFPAKYWQPSVIRLRTEENFGFGYIVRSNTPDLIGLRYNTENKINNFVKKLNPEFIKNNFRKN